MGSMIAITGKARSGKDTAAAILAKHFPNYSTYALAFPIKKCVHTLLGWEDIPDELKESPASVSYNVCDAVKLLGELGLENEGNTPEMLIYKFIEILPEVVTPRIAYQLFGTEICRAILGPDVWTDIAPTGKVIITDLRFSNERVWLRKNRGVVMSIVRKGAEAVSPHESENHPLDADFYISNNSSLERLEQIITLLIPRLKQKMRSVSQ